MPSVATSKCVKYTPKEMYDLVNAVESYPEYLPNCTEVKLLTRTPERLRASITMAKGRIKLNFTTENTMEEGRQIRMRLVEGPFKRLDGLWRFEAQADGGCEVAFRLDFEFASTLLSMAFSGFFREAGESMVDAFCRQAVRTYGLRGKV